MNERIGQWLDIQLQTLVVRLPSYLCDTNHLLSPSQEFEWVEGDRWVMWDVASLYSSIPYSWVLKVVFFVLDQCGLYSRVQREFILECLEYL